MKAVILAGGFGSRLAEETQTRPKPLVEIGGRPILWHIMKAYGHYGINDFVICSGYKGYLIKEYFVNYYLHHADVTVDLKSNETHFRKGNVDPWRVTIVDTGLGTQTGGRIRRVADYLDPGETFLLTYGDGVGDININACIAHHYRAGRKATVTVVAPPGRFGVTVLDGNRVSAFTEKPLEDGGRINAGFFVCEPAVIDLIEDDGTVWEREPLSTLADTSELTAYSHDGFWQPMDTLRDKNELERLWSSGEAPWKVWA